MISVYAIIVLNKEQGTWNEIYHYQKRKFALLKIKELYKLDGNGKIYFLVWHDLIDNQTHCIRVGRRLGMYFDYTWKSLIDNYQKGSLPLVKA